jgi:hypothetical protein
MPKNIPVTPTDLALSTRLEKIEELLKTVVKTAYSGDSMYQNTVEERWLISDSASEALSLIMACRADRLKEDTVIESIIDELLRTGNAGPFMDAVCPPLPPVGSRVVSLTSGFGGRAGVLLKVLNHTQKGQVTGTSGKSQTGKLRVGRDSGTLIGEPTWGGDYIELADAAGVRYVTPQERWWLSINVVSMPADTST